MISNITNISNTFFDYIENKDPLLKKSLKLLISNYKISIIN